MYTSLWINRISPSGPEVSPVPAQDLLRAPRTNPSPIPRWPFNKCSLLLTEPPPKTGSSLVLRKICTVRAAVIVLTLVLLASVLLQAVLCKSSVLLSWAGCFSRVRQLPPIQTLAFLLSSGLSHLWHFHWSHFSSFLVQSQGPCPQEDELLLLPSQFWGGFPEWAQHLHACAQRYTPLPQGNVHLFLHPVSFSPPSLSSAPH